MPRPQNGYGVLPVVDVAPQLLAASSEHSKARRDALESELLALLLKVPDDGPHGTLSVELLQRVDRLLAQLGMVHQALSEPGGPRPA